MCCDDAINHSQQFYPPVMICWNYILIFLLAFVSGYLDTTSGSPSWGESGSPAASSPAWEESKPKCSKHCKGNRQTVCLWGENVPSCYADCKNEVRWCFLPNSTVNCTISLLYNK